MDVSVIIPVYNVSNYIERCITSVMSQTFTGTLECIIVDDCSPDDSIEKCKNLLENYSGGINFSIVRHSINMGLSEARNSGIKVASGKYLYFLDSDDEIPPLSIEKLWEQVIKYPQIDVVMGATLSSFITDYYDISAYKGFAYTENKYWIQYNFFSKGKNIAANAWNKLIRTNLIVENNLYFKPNIIHEDDHWIFYLVQYISNWSFVFENTYIHYKTDNSIMTSLNREKEVRNWFIIMLDHSQNLYEPFYTLQLVRYMDMYFGRWMFEYHYPESRRLHWSFIKACLRKHMWKGTILLLCWTMLYGIRDGFRLKRWLMDYSRIEFQKESDRMSIYNA